MNRPPESLILDAGELAELVVIAQRVRAGPVRQDFLKFRGSNFQHQKYVHGLQGRGVFRIFWSVDDRPILVVMRHTRDDFEWINNAKLTKVPSPVFPGARVHTGFLISSQAVDKTTRLPVVNALTKHLKAAGAEKRSILIIGHSRGGALSQIIAPELVDAFGAEHPGMRVVTFGSPAVYDSEGAIQFNEKMTGNNKNLLRVSHGSDLVAGLPPLGFSSVGHHIWLVNNKIVENPSSFATWFYRLTHPSTMLSNHRTVEYKTALLIQQRQAPDRVW